jgi:hypothetical protein
MQVDAESTEAAAVADAGWSVVSSNSTSLDEPSPWGGVIGSFDDDTVMQ